MFGKLRVGQESVKKLIHIREPHFFHHISIIDFRIFLEFTGRWKMLHYYAKEFFSPILVSPRLMYNREISTFIINDGVPNIVNAMLTVDTFRWDSLTPISSVNTSVTVVNVLNIEQHVTLPTDHTERTKIFYRFSLRNQQSEHLSPFNYIFPVPIKDIDGYKQPNVQVNIEN